MCKSKSDTWWNRFWRGEQATADVNKQQPSTLRLCSHRSSPRRRGAQNPSSLSPLHVKWMVCGYREKRGGKKTFSAAPLAHAPAWLRYCGNQANSWLCVCCDNGERFPGSQRCSAVFAEINPASWVVPDSRVCLCQLSAMPLRPPLSAARRSVPCFSSSFCTDGWHSCSAGPRGLLKKAINQSRHSIQAGNWPIRVAQDAYVRSGIFTNWLSIYTKLGDSTRKIHLFTCHNRRITALPQAADAASQRSEALLLNHTSFIQHTRHVYDSQCCY